MAVESTTTYVWRCDRCRAETAEHNPSGWTPEHNPSGWSWVAYERNRWSSLDGEHPNWLLVCPDCSRSWRLWWEEG